MPFGLGRHCGLPHRPPPLQIRQGERAASMSCYLHACLSFKRSCADFWRRRPSPLIRGRAGDGVEKHVCSTPPPPPPRVSILCLYTCRFTAPAGLSSRRFPASRQANHNHTGRARHFSLSARNPCLMSEKSFSLSDNGQCRTMRKRKANRRPAIGCAPANRHCADTQRKMSKNHRGRRLG